MSSFIGTKETYKVRIAKMMKSIQKIGNAKGKTPEEFAIHIALFHRMESKLNIRKAKNSLENNVLRKE